MTDFRIAMGKIATDRTANSFKGTVAGAASLRKFRIDNPDITFRNKVNKEISKQRGESFDHVKTLDGVLQNIFENNPEIARDPNKIWNMDETGIDCEFGTKEKVASSSSSNHSGSRISADGSGTGVHVTCVVAVSASGLRCPPFFIIQGKHPMSSWTDAIEGKPGQILKSTVLERFTRENWFPHNGVKAMSEKGSMTMQTLPLFMTHFNTFVRRHVPQDEKILMTLDGHSSRKGIDWLDEATKNNIEVAKTPANTSHVLQPCDQRVNKVINSRVRRVRDRLFEAGFNKTKSVKFKLISALAAIDDLSLNDVRVSFSVTGLWPMDMRFLKTFETNADRLKAESQEHLEKQRKPDAVTTEECRSILDNTAFKAEEQLRNLTLLLKIRETVNSILVNIKRRNDTSEVRETTENTAETCLSTNERKKNYRLEQGLVDMSPARHMTHGEPMLKLRQKLALEEQEHRKKEERKAEREREKAAKLAKRGSEATIEKGRRAQKQSKA